MEATGPDLGTKDTEPDVGAKATELDVVTKEMELDEGTGEQIGGLYAERQAYGFEDVGPARSSEVAHDRCERFYSRFLQNLGLAGDESRLAPPAKRTLKRFVAVNHVSAAWYNRELQEELSKQQLYFFCSIVLLIAVPLLIFFVPSLSNDVLGTTNGDVSATSVGAQITVALTGLIGIHRALGSWLGQRKLIGPYWKARADLLDQIYTLETDWGGREPRKKVADDGRLTPEFRAALSAGIAASRKIVRTQMDAFFTNYSLPTIDLTKELTTSATEATKLYGLFRSPEVAAAEARASAAAKKEAEIDTLEGELAGIRAVLAELGAEELALKAKLAESSITGEEKSQAQTDLKVIAAEIRKLKAEERVKIRTLAAKKNS